MGTHLGSRGADMGLWGDTWGPGEEYGVLGGGGGGGVTRGPGESDKQIVLMTLWLDTTHGGTQRF